MLKLRKAFERNKQRDLPRDRWALFALPTMLWILAFIVIPVAIVVFFSFLKKGPYGGIVYQFTLDNYRRAFDTLYLSIFWKSIRLASLTTFFCLLCGYPMAYILATSSQRWRALLMTLLIVPFWTNFVVRTYALKVLFAESGPINDILLSTQVISSPLSLSTSSSMVLIGMVTNYLPFMVLPLYVSLEKFDFSLLEAGRDLGATGLKNLLRVLVPLTFPGIITGSILVFTPALGEFLIPDLLGGARSMLLGNLITEQFLKMRDWPFGSALSVLLILMILAPLFLATKYGAKEKKSHAGASPR